jgi:hypothetical protein
MECHINWDQLFTDAVLMKALKAQAKTPSDLAEFKAAIETNSSAERWGWLSSVAEDVLTITTYNGGMGGVAQNKVYELSERFFVTDGGTCEVWGPFFNAESLPKEFPWLFSLEALVELTGDDINNLISTFQISVDSELSDALTFKICADLVVPGMTIEINGQEYAKTDAGLVKAACPHDEEVCVLYYGSEGGSFGVNLISGKYYTFSDWDSVGGPFDTVEEACAVNPEYWSFGDKMETYSATHNLKSTLPEDQVLRIVQKMVSVGDILILNGKSLMRTIDGYVPATDD